MSISRFLLVGLTLFISVLMLPKTFANTTVNEIVNEDVEIELKDIRVGMSGLYFPFTFVANGELQGFEVDLWEALGRVNGYDVSFVTANFSGLFGLLETNRIDTISNQITITPQRQEVYLFSKPYVIDGAQVVVRKNNKNIDGLADLNGRRVAVNLGSNYEQLLREYDNTEEIDIRTYDSGIEQDVILGRIDAFVMDRLSSIELINSSGLPLRLAGEPFALIENAWPFLNNDSGMQLRDEVNDGLEKLRISGELADISIKWFGADVTTISQQVDDGDS